MKKTNLLQPVGREYDDIIQLPHPVSVRHPQMPAMDRAAQFSPFAALTGYEDAIEETGRVTNIEMELDEDCKGKINRQLLWISDHITNRPGVTITHFIPDEKKEGGRYCTETGVVSKIDRDQKRLLLETGKQIEIDRIKALQIDNQQDFEG